MTGRLIDADKLRAWFESHSVWDVFSVGYIMGLIDEAPTVVTPTVEAIPVEWIKKWIFEHPYFCVTASTLLGDWQMEQRKEE